MSESRTLRRRATRGALAALATTVSLVALAGGAARAQTYTFSTVATFNGTNGANPYAGVTRDSSGNLYGTTFNGGASGSGAAYKIVANSNTITTLASLSGSNNGGTNPLGNAALDSSGNVYGTTYAGGASNAGTVFKVAAGTNALSTLVAFTGANGQTPYSSLTSDSSGNLYGTTSSGGTNGFGTAFRIASGTGALTTLYNFAGSSDGGSPYAGLTLDSSGNLYGSTISGGANGYGTVFKIAAGTSAFSTLASLATPAGTGQANGLGNLAIDSSGNLYGTTSGYGGSGYGTVFKVAAGTNAYSTLATFNSTNGRNPFGSVTLDGSGNLYGTTYGGGTTDSGTVFKVMAGTNALSTLVNFTGTNGANPIGSLAIDGTGNLYGTASSGGANNYGTVFKLTVSGSAAPEPGTMALMGAFLLPMGGLVVRRRLSASA